MFVEHKEAVEIAEQPAKVVKISQAIRAGSDLITENRDCFLRDGCGCALGAAMAHIGFKSQEEWLDHMDYSHFSTVGIIAKKFNVPQEIILEASSNHYQKRMNREQIADWLESKGY